MFTNAEIFLGKLQHAKDFSDYCPRLSQLVFAVFLCYIGMNQILLVSLKINMTANPSATARINAMREKLERSRANAAEGLIRFEAAQPKANIDVPNPSSSLRAMLARVKFDQMNGRMHQEVPVAH